MEVEDFRKLGLLRPQQAAQKEKESGELFPASFNKYFVILVFLFLDYLLDVVISGKLINPFPLKIDSAVLTVTVYRFLDGVVVSGMGDVVVVIFFDVRSAALGAFELFCHFTFFLFFSLGDFSIAQ